jgi:DUF438 domain-containing protein
MSKTEELVHILKLLNEGKPVHEVRHKAKELLKSINPTDLSLAEQKLIDEGLPPEELRGMCVIHMEMLSGELDTFFSQLPPGHPVQTMILEHQKLLEFLTELETWKASVVNTLTVSHTDLMKLKELAQNLLDAEKHHQREEDVLFPVMEYYGISGPCRVMRLEHDELRSKKQALRQIANSEPVLVNGSLDLVFDIIKNLIFTLRDHIFKENHILYPTAIQTITNPQKWDEMKKSCDQIGYCPFTPHK